MPTIRAVNASEEVHDRLLEPEVHAVREAEQLLERMDGILRNHAEPALVGDGRAGTVIPTEVFSALRTIVQALAGGRAVTILPSAKQLTTQQAADLLHCSRPHVIKLLEEGEIPFHRVGTHRRIKLEDVLEYRRRRQTGRRKSLRELTRLSQEYEGSTGSSRGT